MKKRHSKTRLICALMGIVLIIPFVLSCDFDDDEDTKITVCNLDDQKYDVEIRKESDDTVVDELRVEEWYTLGDQCDTSKNLDQGRYYLVIFDDEEITDESNDFYLDDGETLNFEIHNSGDIVEKFSYEEKAFVNVCNTADEAYRVALKQSSDDGLVAEVDLRQCHDFENLDQGSYYIEIFNGADNTVTDRSDDFYLEANADEYFTITQPGVLANERLQ